jgi:hypothetical protein
MFFDGAKPTCPGVPWRDLRFRGPLLETRREIPPVVRAHPTAIPPRLALVGDHPRVDMLGPTFGVDEDLSLHRCRPASGVFVQVDHGIRESEREGRIQSAERTVPTHPTNQKVTNLLSA